MKHLPPAILITAGTKRLGFHLVKTSLIMGYSVIVHYRSSNRAALSWLRRHPHYQSSVFFIQRDLDVSPESIFDEAAALPCAIVGLVNNASIFSPGNLTDPCHLQSMLNIHCMVPARLGARFHQTENADWIINITDAAIKRPNSTWQNYRISKLILEELTRQQATVFAPKCRVNALAPGAILPVAGSNRREFDTLARSIPLRSTTPVASFTDAFRFLVGNTSITGQVIAVDGGWHLTA